MHQRWHVSIRKMRQAHDWDNLQKLITGMDHPFYLVKYLDGKDQDVASNDPLVRDILIKHKKFLLAVKRVLATVNEKSDEELFHIYKDFEVISGELIEIMISFDNKQKTKSLRAAIGY